MKKTLGLTMDYDSIGWAVVEKAGNKGRIIKSGVRVFQSNIKNIGEGDREQLSSYVRNDARDTRKKNFRRKIRKQLLLKELIKHDMCPMTMEEFHLWKTNKIFPISTTKDWLKLNPYELRQRATHKQISKQEIGRVLYHLSQRRGKIQSQRGRGKPVDAIYNGLFSEKRPGIKHAASHLKNQTLGTYLYSLLPKNKTSYKSLNERVRNRYLDRAMFVSELHEILNTQANYYPEINTQFIENLGGTKNSLREGILFYQRPVKSQKFNAGMCPYEPKKTRTPFSHPAHEKFNVARWVNSIECNGKSLSQEQRNIAMTVPLKYAQFSFKKVKKALGLLSPEYQFNYKDSDTSVLAHTLVQLSKPHFFGDEFFKMSEEEQEKIWHVMYFFDDKNKLEDYAKKKWNFSKEQAKRLANISLKRGYAELSHKAITHILPFIDQGFSYKKSVVLGGVKNTFGVHWDHLTSANKVALIKEVEELMNESNNFSIKEKLADLISHHNPSDQPLKLGLYGVQDTIVDTLSKLPVSFKEDNNIQKKFRPVLQKPVFEMRNIVNRVIENYGSLDSIHVYVRPFLKSSKENRKLHLMDQKKRIAEREANVKKIIELGENPTPMNVLKYTLWDECNQICPYTGNKISTEELFSNDVSIVYILPWSRFLNDSDNNKTLCMSWFKHKIQNYTPYEYFLTQETGEWEQVKTRAFMNFVASSNRSNRFQKFKHFVVSRYASDALSKELEDQHHISLEIKEFLKLLTPNVQMTLGHSTHSLRSKWYLDFNSDTDNPLSDYRRHGLDAIITAVKNKSFLEALSQWNRYEKGSDSDVFPIPWKSFRTDVKQSFQDMGVSFKQPRKLLSKQKTKFKKKGVSYTSFGVAARGQLHKELNYGKRTPPLTNEAYHIRKPLHSLHTAKQVQKIVDPVIRNLVYELVDKKGGFVKGKIPNGALSRKNKNGAMITKLFINNKSGDPVPVNKIRLREQISNAIQVRKGKNLYTNPRNNHHVLIYVDNKKNHKEEVVSFWTAIQRRVKKTSLYQLPEDGQQIVTALHNNDYFLLGIPKDVDWQRLPVEVLRKHLYRVQRLSSKFYEFRLLSDANIYDTFYPNYIRILNFGSRKTGWSTYNPIKIHMDILGNISAYKSIENEMILD